MLQNWAQKNWYFYCFQKGSNYFSTSNSSGVIDEKLRLTSNKRLLYRVVIRMTNLALVPFPSWLRAKGTRAKPAGIGLLPFEWVGQRKGAGLLQRPNHRDKGYFSRHPFATVTTGRLEDHPCMPEQRSDIGPTGTHHVVGAKWHKKPPLRDKSNFLVSLESLEHQRQIYPRP
jgi:hypothetical protein